MKMNKQTILVVDDTESNLKLTKDIFELAGFAVITAEDGEMAFAILAEHRVDLVITDIMMPNVDGYLLCYTIKASDKLSILPVIIYSATFTSSSDELMAIETGADKFIRKPASMDVLVSAAKELLSISVKGTLKKPGKPNSLKVTRLYNEGLVHKLELRNVEVEEAKVKLERSEARLKAAQSIACTGSWEIDMTSGIHQWSDELFYIFGSEVDETLPSTDFFLSFMHPDDLEFATNRMKTAFETLNDSSFDFRFLSPRGSVRYGYTLYRFEFDNDHKPVRLYGIVQDTTENRLVDEALRTTRDRLLFHMENTTLGFIEMDDQNFIKSWSKTAEKIFGWSKQELTNIRTAGLSTVHEDDLALMDNIAQQLVRGEVSSNKVQYRNYTKSGKVIWCEAHNSIIKDNDGKVVTIMSLVQDITESKEAEQKKEFDRNNLKALLNNTNDLIWSVDREFKIITSNEAFDAMVMLMSGKVVSKGSNVLDTAFSSKEVDRFREYYERAFKGEIFTEIEHSTLPFEVWSEISYYPIYKEDTVVGTACFSRDITAKRKIGNHLRLLESVITNTNDSVLITESGALDQTGPKIVYVNNAFTKMTGYESAEVIGKTPRILQGEKSDRSQLDKVTAALLAGEHVEVEIINYKKNREQFWNNFTIVPVVDKDGKNTHCISIQRDVTARRHGEQLARKKLETLVRERTRELNDALRKEKDLVEMKNKFVTIASHEFRTPLATISFAAEFIRNYFHQLTGEEIARKLTKIVDQTSHMTSLLEDILTLGKSEAGKIKMKYINLDLKEFVESIIEEVRFTVKAERQINFIFSCTNSRVNSDDKLLRNIFNNLLTNALKFSGPETPITVTVTDLNEEIVITVTDEGIGIVESEMPCVFESFQRGSNASAVAGTGLGLSILKKAVDLMEGFVEVKSVVNKGSTFTVRIPIL
ncbi:MAG: hypothetical protein C0490_04095 [Marivirga sp.]|nr:hypothetical protein [Marivirga sp.]